MPEQFLTDSDAIPVIDSVHTDAVDLSANTTDQVLVAAPGANKQIWVYGLVLRAGTGDGTILLHDDVSLSGTMPVAQKYGIEFQPSGNFAMPWLKANTNKALLASTATCSADGLIIYAVVSV